MGSRSSKSRSSKSSSSRNASSRSSIQDKAIEEKIKVAELIAESNFTEQKLKIEYEAKRLEMEEKVAKSQARAKVLDLLDMPPLEDEEATKGRNIITVIPYLEMETQIILFLTKIASLGQSKKCCACYLNSRGHQKLILMLFQGILSNITTSWKYSRK